MRLSEFDINRFLRESWQRKPFLIRKGMADWINPLAPEELAGLACESDTEARLIVQQHRGWTVEHGPFVEDRFSQLGADPWTLLVQAVDHHVPAVAALIEPFRFIPDWRIDDVMVSYAVEGGGVGPHFDQYDVFLLQGLGTRRWQIGAQCDKNCALMPHDDLRLLADFEAADEWLLDPGDILYVPPGVAHNGIAASADCMTYSIGFRAPGLSEMLAGWSDSLIADLGDDDYRYGDPDLFVQDNPGEITSVAIDQLHALMTERLLDRAAFARWFASASTTSKYPEIDWAPDKPFSSQFVRESLAGGVPLIRNSARRFAFIREAASISLFVDGDCFPCSGVAAEFAQRLCADTRFHYPPAWAKSDAVVELVMALLDRGSLAFDLPD